MQILRIYHNHCIYTKTEKSFEDRRDRVAWKHEVANLSGVYWNSGWQVPNTLAQVPQANMLLVHDFNAHNLDEAYRKQRQSVQDERIKRTWNPAGRYHYQPELVLPVQLRNSFRRFEIFRLQEQAGTWKLHLHYDLFEIGDPHRDHFMLCELRPGEVVEVKINGKLDHTASAGSRRLYKELCYRFQLSEPFEHYQSYNPQQVSPPSIQVPHPTHTVDLMKRLY